MNHKSINESKFFNIYKPHSIYFKVANVILESCLHYWTFVFLLLFFHTVLKRWTNTRVDKIPKLPASDHGFFFVYLFSLITLKKQKWKILGTLWKPSNKINRNKIRGWLEHERLVSVHVTFSFYCWNVTNINCYCSAVLHCINICANSHCEYMKCFDGQRGEFPHVLVSSLYEETTLYALTELSHSCCSASAWVLSSLFFLLHNWFTYQKQLYCCTGIPK